AGEQRGGQTVIADGRAALGHGERALLVLGEVLLARPDDLDGFADLAGYLGRLARGPGAAAAVAAEAAAQEHGVGVDGLGVDAELVGDQGDRRRLILRRRPHVDATGLYLHGRVDRL